MLRVRVWRGNAVPEDASWAVLPEARTSRVAVAAEAHGFATKSLRVTVDDRLMLTVADLQGNILQRDAVPVRWEGDRFEVSKTRTFDDHFFGLGDKPGPLDRGGQAFTMWNTDAFGWQESTDPIYKDIPFFFDVNKGHALGVFLDNTWRTNFDFGRADDKRYTFGSLNGPVDYYLMYGPEPKAVVSTWAWLTGPTPLPPLWALGFQQSRYSYFPASQLREVAGRLRADKIPSDVLWLDIDFQHNNWPFTVDEKNYPDFKGMVKDLAQDKFKLVVITDLHVAQQPNVGYTPYDTGMAGDHFVKNPDGTVYHGWVWPGNAVFPDFTQARTRTWWGQQFRTFVDDGVAGFWNDMNEPSVFNVPGKTMPDDVQHRIDEPGFKKRTANHLEIHNIFGLENTRGTYEGEVTLRPNERPFVMTRASYAGGQRYSTTWTGDNSATWNHLQQTVPQLVNLGLSGFALAGADVGWICWVTTAGAADEVDRDFCVSANRPGPQREGYAHARGVGGRAGAGSDPAAVYRGAVQADAVPVHDGGGDEPHGFADRPAGVPGVSACDSGWCADRPDDGWGRISVWEPRAGSAESFAGRSCAVRDPPAAGHVVRLLDRCADGAHAAVDGGGPGAAGQGAGAEAAAGDAKTGGVAGVCARRLDFADGTAGAEHGGDAAGTADAAGVPVQHGIAGAGDVRG